MLFFQRLFALRLKYIAVNMGYPKPSDLYTKLPFFAGD